MGLPSIHAGRPVKKPAAPVRRRVKKKKVRASLRVKIHVIPVAIRVSSRAGKFAIHRSRTPVDLPARLPAIQTL